MVRGLAFVLFNVVLYMIAMDHPNKNTLENGGLRHTASF